MARIVRTAEQVAGFCRRVCTQLECCPNLLSPVLVADHCPENCSVHTKTRYSELGTREKWVKARTSIFLPHAQPRAPSRVSESLGLKLCSWSRQCPESVIQGWAGPHGQEAATVSAFWGDFAGHYTHQSQGGELPRSHPGLAWPDHTHLPTLTAYYYGKRKRVVRPSMGECKAQRTPLKPARRRKRRRSVFMQKKRRVGTVEAEAGSGEVRVPFSLGSPHIGKAGGPPCLCSPQESEDEEAEALGMDSRSEGSDLELPESQVDEAWELPSVRSHSATAPRSNSEPVCQPPPETTPQGLRAPPPASVLGDSQGGQSPASGQDMAKVQWHGLGGTQGAEGPRSASN